MGRRKKVQEPVVEKVDLSEMTGKRVEETVQETVQETVEETVEAKSREQVFSELKETVDKTVTAFEMAAKENRELAFRIIASKKELERISKRLN